MRGGRQQTMKVVLTDTVAVNTPEPFRYMTKHEHATFEKGKAVVVTAEKLCCSVHRDVKSDRAR